MAVLIAEIDGNCISIIFSVVLVWRKSGLFSVSVYITGYISLHNQTPLHTTLSKIVFNGHSICFYYIMIYPVSSAYIIGVVRFDDLMRRLFEQFNISVILFTVLLANQVIIFSMSEVHVPLVLPCLLNPKVLSSYFKQVIVPVVCFLVIYFLPCLLTKSWFVSCQPHQLRH